MSFSKSSNFGIIIPVIVALFNVFLILNPSQVIIAGREGLLLWFNQVLPTLLPFVVGANLLASLGFIHFMGALAAPIMVPLFKVPGAGAYALLTGVTSGYPMGAKAVAHLRETGQITKDEAQRLISFSNNAGPLFVIGFVGAGLFSSVRFGYILLASHLAAAVTVGIIIRLLFSKNMSNLMDTENIGIKAAFIEYRHFMQNHYKGFGAAFGGSVKNAMESLVLVGGFIIVFSVAIKVLEVGGLFDLLGQNAGIAAGILEVANGAKMLAAGGPPNAAVLAVTAGIISFGGFSVHSQVAHFIKDTDIRFLPYLGAKVLQSVLAGGICWWLV